MRNGTFWILLCVCVCVCTFRPSVTERERNESATKKDAKSQGGTAVAYDNCVCAPNRTNLRY